jgi:MOSC domain-containing protein YiiM
MEGSTDDPRVVAVHVAPEAGAPVEPRAAVEAVADHGLRGDRYFATAGTFSDSDRDATFIQGETLDAAERDDGVCVAPGDHRRNVTTRGVGRNRLVGRRFVVGDAVFEGVELCEPCSYLERTLEREGVRDALVHRGGIRARVAETGAFGSGDAVVERDAAPGAARPRSE